jgi:RNA polymerase sigma-70 factor (ECF subfamily)
MSPSDALLTHWFDSHRAFLWGLCYRITGSAADADDVVQETFIRALEHAPADLEEPRRWLVKVAVNASRDLLRRRKRHAYIGPWLPEPIETEHPAEDAPASYEPLISSERTLEGRYDLMESVSLAFLQALEALTPTQRAVLLLRDVFDYSAAEAAAALEISEGNTRTTHHRARRAMEAYERRRAVPTPAARKQTADALARFLDLLGKADVRGIERMLAADVRAISDGGGKYTAARHPIVGRAAVARFFARLAMSRGPGIRIRTLQVNGYPAALVDAEAPMGRRPPRLVLAVDLDAEGLVSSIWVMVNPRKLTAFAPRSEPALTGRVVSL